MRLPILLVALVSTALAQQSPQRSARTPQALVRYNDPNGSKVDWKFYVPQNELHSAASQRAERGQPIHPQQSLHPSQSQLIQAQQEPQHQIQYKTYTQVPAPIQVQAPIHAQPDAAHDVTQVQYKDYTQAEVPVEHQPDLGQAQYTGYAQAQVPVELQPQLNQISYKQYPEAPAHAKQLDSENFKPQRAYVDPSPVLYSSNYAQQYEQQQVNAELPQYEQPSVSYAQNEQKSRRDYSNRGFQGRIVYKHEQPPQQQLPHAMRVPVFIESLPVPPIPKLLVSKNMPADLQQLLQYQAFLPHGGANSMSVVRPKTLFVPEPISDDGKRQGGYRSKTYYLSNNDYQQPVWDSKPVHEDQRH